MLNPFFSRIHSTKAAIIALVPALVFVFSGSILAQDTNTSADSSEIQELRNIINDLQNRLNQLEAKNKAAAKAAEKPVRKPVTIDGYLQTRYRVDNSQGVPDEFLIRRARANIRATVNEHVSGRIELKLENKANGKGAGSDPVLRETFIEYANQGGRLRMGQTVVPFDYELLTSSTKLWTGERALVVDKLFPEQVDAGLQYVLNKGPKLPTYSVAIYNGAGINADDDNSRKDPVASILLPYKTGSFMVGYYNGRKGRDVAATDRDRLGLGTKFDFKHLAFQGEYITADDKGNDVSGWYGQLGWKLPESTLAFVKYDQYDENEDLPNDLFQRTTVGIFRDFDPFNRITLAYEFRDADTGFTDYKTFSGNQGFVQWQWIY